MVAGAGGDQDSGLGFRCFFLRWDRAGAVLADGQREFVELLRW